MSNVISIFKNKKPDTAYQSKLDSMNKLELMEEMVEFQEWRSATGVLTPEMIEKGIPLFKALLDCAETEELRILARAYKAHLERELEALKK